MSILTKILGDPNEKVIKGMQPLVDKINGLEEKFKGMSDKELKKMTDEFRKKLGVEKNDVDSTGLPRRRSAPSRNDSKDDNNEIATSPGLHQGPRNDRDIKLDEILPEAFAVVREMAKRTLGQRHYDVQLLGGIILHRGQITEMKTGEGKTLVATLPAYLNALAGKGVHIITVNDYLAKRDAGWMGAIYYKLGLSTGVIIHDTALIYDPEYIDEKEKDEKIKHFRTITRKEAYACDITYGTNNEFGFDYLRDNMAPNLDSMVQRDLHYTIVDEIDSILIDEARTPLIISAPVEESTDKYCKFSQLVQRLDENVPSASSEQGSTPEGKPSNSAGEQAGQGDYNIDEKMRAATLTEAGIAKMEKWLGIDNIYVEGGIREVHHIEQALKARVLFKRDKDYVVKDGEIIIVDEFTGRLMPGRRYSEGLHQAIEAKEGATVQRESQTLATITFQNYFRMYKKLSGMTGTAVTEAEEFAKIYNLETIIVPTNKPMVRKDLNDLIYRTEKGKFQAVIKDVKTRNKKGQPVLIGTISIEKNELLAEMMEREGLHPEVLNAKNHAGEAQIIAQAGQINSITIATNMAGRGVDIVLGGALTPNPSPTSEVAGEGKDEKNTLNTPLNPLSRGESSTESNEQEKVKQAGGLHIIGTERHESRRIDNQLRGRAGRQGDAGSSQFYVSADDDLMRIFGGDRMKNLMTTLRLPEDMPIQNKMVSRSIESAQKKVEGNNFDIRKHLVEYDDVINKHREAIYKKRREILELVTEDKEVNINQRDPSPAAQDDNNSLSEIILNMVENEIEQVVSFHTSADDIKTWNLEEITQVASTIFPVTEKLKTDLDKMAGDPSTGSGQVKLDKAKARTVIIEHLVKVAQENYGQIKEQFEKNGMLWVELEKAILIRSIDTLWIEHLEAMASMRQGIGLRGYGQKDPLVEYKKEAYSLYNQLNNLIQRQVVYSIFKVGDVQQFSAPGLMERAKQFKAPAKVANSNSSSFSNFKPVEKDGGSVTAGIRDQGLGNGEIAAKEKVRDAEGKKVGRNDLCPCGSGKKFKKCCGK